jgi:hypothetical protein
MHGSTGGSWKRGKEPDHGHRGGTTDRETGGIKTSGPNRRRSHRASSRPYSGGSGGRRALGGRGSVNVYRFPPMIAGS